MSVSLSGSLSQQLAKNESVSSIPSKRGSEIKSNRIVDDNTSVSSQNTRSISVHTDDIGGISNEIDAVAAVEASFSHNNTDVFDPNNPNGAFSNNSNHSSQSNLHEVSSNLIDKDDSYPAPSPSSLSTGRSSRTNNSESEYIPTVLNGKAKKRPVPNKYGFLSDNVYASTDRLATVRKPPGQFWRHIISDLELHPERKSKYKKVIRRGIPNSERRLMWQALAGYKKVFKEGYFDKLCNEEDSPWFEIIERDISRCFPDHIMFAKGNGEGQTMLRNVLRAYAVHNPEIGYCQGMGMIVGMLLMHMSEEEAFWMLHITLEDILKDFFTPTLLQIRADAAVFEALLFKCNKKLAIHLHEQEVTPLMFITQWFLTIYTTSLPWGTVLRIWDMMYCEGIKPLFRVGLAILKKNRDYLLKDCPTNAEILTFLLHLPPKLHGQDLIDISLTIHIKRSDIERLRFKICQKSFPETGTLSMI